MKNIASILLSVVALMFTFGVSAAPVLTHDDPLVKELEFQYAKFSGAAHKGDMKTFRALRTDEANAGIPPGATGAELKQMADMMAPDLSGFKFQQMESKGKYARIAYIKKDKESLSIVVQLFEKDGAGWKVGGNYSHDYIGQAPKEAAALKDALSNPEAQFPK